MYAPTSSYDDSEVDEFYIELQSLDDQTKCKTFWLYAKIGEDTQEDWFVDLSAIWRPMTEGSGS